MTPVVPQHGLSPRALARPRYPRNRDSSTPQHFAGSSPSHAPVGGAAAIRGGLVFLVVVLGLSLLLLLHDRLLALERPQQGRAAVGVLVRQGLPDLRHLQQDGPTFSGRKGLRDLQTLARKATVARAGREIVRHGVSYSFTRARAVHAPCRKSSAAVDIGTLPPH